MPFDQLEEDRRAVLDRLGEDLQQIAVLVAVGEDPQLAQHVHGHPGLADPLAERVVVGVGGVQELHARRPHGAHGADDVVGGQGDVLDAGAAVELQVLVDLRLLLRHGGLVERELHLAGAVGDHLGHQRGVLGGDVVADELLHVGEGHDVVVEGDPLVHPAELDVADAVVDGLEQPGPGLGDRLRGDVAGQVGAGVVAALDQGVAGLAVGGDGGQDDGAVLVGDLVGLLKARRAVLDGVAVRGPGVRHLQRQVGHPVAVCRDVFGEETALVGGRPDDGEEDEPGAARLQDVAGDLPAAGLRAAVGDEPHAEGRGVVVRRLLGVAHGEDDRVHALDREGVRLARGKGCVVQRLSHAGSVAPTGKVRNSSLSG